MNAQIYSLLNNKMTHDMFRSELTHLKEHTSAKEFVTILLKYDFIRNFWKKEWHFEAFYTLALFDYLSDVYHAPQLSIYDDIRQYSLDEFDYPSSLKVLDAVSHNTKACDKARKECETDPYGKYFYKYRIIEKE